MLIEDTAIKQLKHAPAMDQSAADKLDDILFA